jgi:hypothetical protein
MPKASCQIDEQGGLTVRSTFLATVAACHAAFVVGAPHPVPLTVLVVPAITKPSLPDMPCRLDPSAQLQPQLFHRHKGET